MPGGGRRRLRRAQARQGQALLHQSVMAIAASALVPRTGHQQLVQIQLGSRPTLFFPFPSPLACAAGGYPHDSRRHKRPRSVWEVHSVGTRRVWRPTRGCRRETSRLPRSGERPDCVVVNEGSIDCRVQTGTRFPSGEEALEFGEGGEGLGG